MRVEAWCFQREKCEFPTLEKRWNISEMGIWETLEFVPSAVENQQRVFQNASFFGAQG